MYPEWMKVGMLSKFKQVKPTGKIPLGSPIVDGRILKICANPRIFFIDSAQNMYY